MIPSFLLAKLYVKDSLKNTDNGFEFALKNIIDSTMLIGIGPIGVGEQNYEGEVITMTVADKTYQGAKLSPLHNRFPITMRESAMNEAKLLTEERVKLVSG
jgi:hypothetical protein